MQRWITLIGAAIIAMFLFIQFLFTGKQVLQWLGLG